MDGYLRAKAVFAEKNAVVAAAPPAMSGRSEQAVSLSETALISSSLNAGEPIATQAAFSGTAGSVEPNTDGDWNSGAANLETQISTASEMAAPLQVRQDSIGSANHSIGSANRMAVLSDLRSVERHTVGLGSEDAATSAFSTAQAEEIASELSSRQIPNEFEPLEPSAKSPTPKIASGSAENVSFSEVASPLKIATPLQLKPDAIAKANRIAALSDLRSAELRKVDLPSDAATSTALSPAQGEEIASKLSSRQILKRFETLEPAAKNLISKLAIESPEGASLSDTLLEDRAGPLIDLKSSLSTRINGEVVGKLAFRQTEQSLAVNVGSLLDLVETQMEKQEFARLRNAAASDTFLSLSDMNAMGIAIEYDPVYDEFNIGSKDHLPANARKVHIDQINDLGPKVDPVAMPQVTDR